MPQSSLRSVVYRSFVTCDDPKGVIERGTIRKSKSDPQKIEGKIETQRISKNSNKSSSSSSSSIYMRANKETEEMLSNSKGTLQEDKDSSSLQLMEVSRGAQKLNWVIDSWSNGVSLEGQSKDIAKDLLKGALDLQESLMMLGKLQEASQYMNKTKKKQKEKEKDEFGVQRSNSDRFGQNCQVGFRNPSPSANGSSRDCFEELRDVIRESFARQNLLPNSPYEEKVYFHTKKVDSSPDLPSTSSSRSTMAFTHDFSSSDCSFSSKGGTEEKPKRSNLIAKLMGLEEASSKNTFDSFSQENMEREKVAGNQRRPVFDIDMRHMPKSRKPHSLVQKAEREKMSLDEIIEMMQFKGLLNSNKPRTRNMNSCVDETYSSDSPPIVIMKPWRKPEEPSTIMECRGGVLNSIETRRKPRVQDTPVKKKSPEKGSGFKKSVLAKQEDKEVKIKEIISFNKTKGSVPSRAKQDKKGTIEKKVDKIQKMAPCRRKSIERENLKSTSVPKIVEQSKQSPTKQRKVESKSNTTRDRAVQLKSTSLNSVSPKSSERRKGVKNEKPVNKSLSTKVEKIRCKDDEIAINLTSETKSDMSVMLHTQEEAIAPEIMVKENCDNINTLMLSDDVTLPSTQHGSVFSSPKEAERNNLLLNNTSFLDDAYALFNIYTYESETDDSRLLVDCKNEILEHESRQQIPTHHPLLFENLITRSRFCIDSDKLSAKVREGIETLKSYTSAGEKRAPADAVYGVLERDLKCREGVGGGWGVGWRKGYTVGEIEEVVGDIDKFVLSQLIDEVVLGFWGLGL